MKSAFDNLVQNLPGKYIQISGSAHETTDLDKLRYSHKLIRSLTSALLSHGAKLIVAAGSEEMVNPENPSWETALYYDWNVLETIGNFIDLQNSINPSPSNPLVIIVSSEKAESQIPKWRQELWNHLLATGVIHLERLPPGWNSGGYRRAREAEYGDCLLIVGGGEGVEHSSQLYVKVGKPVVPIDLQIKSRYLDGKGGAPELSREALSYPTKYLGPIENGTTRLANISTQDGCASIKQIVPRILQLLDETVAISKNKEIRTAEEKSRTVFVVHGRNYELRDSMFNFLRTIGLEPIEWTQAVKWTGKGSPPITEILDVAFERAQATVVLMSPDDEARLRPKFQSENDPPHERNLVPQARANVIFEAGMAFGRDFDRTVLVEVGKLRPFTDISGLHTIRLDDSADKRHALAMRLRTAGCQVNLNGTDWHSAGDFRIVMEIEHPVVYPNFPFTEDEC